LSGKAIGSLLGLDAGPESSRDKTQGEEDEMTTAKSFNRQKTWDGQVRAGVTALEGSRKAQFIDYSRVEESYELLPSGD
jgi:hypothetical protein